MKTGCEAASRLQVGLAPLFAVLPATEVAETAQTAQADSSTATEKVGFRASSPQLAIPGLEAVIFSEEAPLVLCHPPNRQNDRVWADSSSEVSVFETVKQPTKAMV